MTYALQELKIPPTNTTPPGHHQGAPHALARRPVRAA